MAEKEYLTVKEFAVLANVSTQSIYKRLRNYETDGLHKFTKVENKKKLINIKALEYYLDESELQLKQPKVDEVVQLDNQINNQFLDELEFLRQELKAKNDQISKLNNQLDTQLENKDKQISELNQRLADSQEITRNQQVLLKIEQGKMLGLEAPRESIFQKLMSKRTKVK
jgi:hypothetical protein